MASIDGGDGNCGGHVAGREMRADVSAARGAPCTTRLCVASGHAYRGAGEHRVGATAGRDGHVQHVQHARSRGEAEARATAAQVPRCGGRANVCADLRLLEAEVEAVQTQAPLEGGAGHVYDGRTDGHPPHKHTAHGYRRHSIALARLVQELEAMDETMKRDAQGWRFEKAKGSDGKHR